MRISANGNPDAGRVASNRTDLAHGRKLRIALYSHDTMGLGHIRRNMLIARTLDHSPFPASILLIAGTREACAFSLPPGADCVIVPALYKETGGEYRARFLGVSLEELIALRAQAIAAALASFGPDLLIVDKVPRGALRELEPALEQLRLQGTRCVLGLRDVLDDPASVRREWREGGSEEAIRDLYDAVWVYGDPRVYDQVNEYGYSADVAAKLRYTGYVMRPVRTTFSEIDGAELLPLNLGPPERLVLCMVGGGQDGPQLAETFAQLNFPPQTKGVILTGPFMPPEIQQRLFRLALGNPRLRVLKFVTDPDLLLSLADRVIAMGGYNTVCEILASEKRALIIPRIKPRQEQLIRARRLRELELIDMLHPDDLSPQALAHWLAQDRKPPRRVSEQIDFNGAVNLPRMVGELLAGSSAAVAALPRERNLEYAR
jgi:predicted glycosyltransferase